MPVGKTTDVFRIFQEFLLEKRQMAAELFKNSEKVDISQHMILPEFPTDKRHMSSEFFKNSCWKTADGSGILQEFQCNWLHQCHLGLQRNQGSGSKVNKAIW